jgi:hypothetical protein
LAAWLQCSFHEQVRRRWEGSGSELETGACSGKRGEFQRDGADGVNSVQGIHWEEDRWSRERYCKAVSVRGMVVGSVEEKGKRGKIAA